MLFKNKSEKMLTNKIILSFIIFLHVIIVTVSASIGDKILVIDSPNQYLHYESKSLYKGSNIFIRVDKCEPHTANITVNLHIWQLPCLPLDEDNVVAMEEAKNFTYIYQFNNTYQCSEHIIIDEPKKKPEKELKTGQVMPVYTVSEDAFYMVKFRVYTTNSASLTLDVKVEMKSHDGGFLSAADWPLLPFYGFMCIYYVILGMIWLLLSFMQWRDLLRVQFWIGGVILLGMLEKATFYAEFQNINNTGVKSTQVMLFAEWVSCAKRTLARMLVVIVSLGFGIVKPRLGSTLHRVVGVGLLYFFLAGTEAYLRITRTSNVPSKDVLIASVPLAMLDSAICWWIFSALVNTTRTLRLRRNETKLALYRHFTNTLIFSVVASVFFILYCIKVHHMVSCLEVWKDFWLEDAYWHIQFSALLLVIIILWRPTNNNQRYAFVPLIDTGDEEEEQLVNDAYGVKVRVHYPKSNNGGQTRNSVEDDLKWLEENIKSDPALPILDSDEELVNTRFEVSKMQ